MKIKQRSRAGFSLIEVLIAILLVFAFSGVIATSLSNLIRYNGVNAAKMQASLAVSDWIETWMEKGIDATDPYWASVYGQTGKYYHDDEERIDLTEDEVKALDFYVLLTEDKDGSDVFGYSVTVAQKYADVGWVSIDTYIHHNPEEATP